ncbi:MAG: hypothetical protein QW232_08195 [Saccharolobus sp.]
MSQMKKLVVVGGGNAGTLLSNLLAGKLEITLIEPSAWLSGLYGR